MTDALSRVLVPHWDLKLVPKIHYWICSLCVLCNTIKPRLLEEPPWPCSPAKAVENIWDHSPLEKGS